MLLCMAATNVICSDSLMTLFSQMFYTFEVQRVRQVGLTISTADLLDNILTVSRVYNKRITRCSTPHSCVAEE